MLRGPFFAGWFMWHAHGPPADCMWRVCAFALLQVRGVVVVSRATQRTFGASEWQALAGQLASWRDSIKEVQVSWQCFG